MILRCIVAVARKARDKSHNDSSGNKKGKLQGPTSDCQALKTKSMDEILGVEALNFGLAIGDVLTPKSSFQQLQQRSNVRTTFNYWLQSIHRSGEKQKDQLIDGMSPIPIFPENMVEFDDENELNDNIGQRNVNNTVNHTDIQTKLNETMNLELVKISSKDTVQEINFWKSPLICYMLDLTLQYKLWMVFSRRIWKWYHIDKIAMVKKGMSLVCFTVMDSCDTILAGHYFFLKKKPLMLKPWNPDMYFEKEDIKTLPIWVQLKIEINIGVRKLCIELSHN